VNRNLIVALVLLVIALAGMVAVFEFTDRNASGVTGQAFLEGFSANGNAINRVDLRFPDGEEGITLRREGDLWLVDQRDGYPADFEAIASLVTSLANARIVEQKTSNPSNYGQLGVDDPAQGGAGTGIELSGDDFAYDVIVGNPAQQSFQYARLADTETSYLVDQQFEVPASIASWLVDEIIDMPADRISKVTIEHADGETIVIEKASRENADFSVLDVPEGRELSYPTAGNEIAGALAGLTLDDVRKGQAGDPAGDPLSTAAFETWDGLRIVVTVVSGDEEQWLSFAASEGSADTNEPNEETASEVDDINSRLGEWQYRVADYQGSRFARRWEDILAAEQEEEEM
jgi:hypothetical protein